MSDRARQIQKEIAELFTAMEVEDEPKTRQITLSLVRGGLTDLARMADAVEKIAQALGED